MSTAQSELAERVKSTAIVRRSGGPREGGACPTCGTWHQVNTSYCVVMNNTPLCPACVDKFVPYLGSAVVEIEGALA